MISENKVLNKTKETFKIIKHLLLRLIKLKNKIHKINRNCYGINRDIESLIHRSKENLHQSFIYLDKAYYQIKENILDKEKYIELFKK